MKFTAWKTNPASIGGHVSLRSIDGVLVLEEHKAVHLLGQDIVDQIPMAPEYCELMVTVEVKI